MGIKREITEITELPHVVIFGKVVESKTEGVYIDGTYFGGVGETRELADEMARECTREFRGGIVVPKIFPMTKQWELQDIIRMARLKFYEMEQEMFEVEELETRLKARKK